MICRKLGGILKIYSILNSGTQIQMKIRCKELDEVDNGKEDESCVLDSGQRKSVIDQMSKYFKGINNMQSSLHDSAFAASTYSRIPKSLIVLIVDDQTFNIMVLRNMLNSLQINNISEALNGREAIHIVNMVYTKFDQITIFMDVDMPIMNGIEATKCISENDKQGKIKIIMLSAFNSEEIVKDSLNAGAMEFFVKPISYHTIKELKNNGIFLF